MLQLHREFGADGCRFASAYLLVYQENRRTCSRSLPIALEFSSPFADLGAARIPVGWHRPIGSTACMRKAAAQVQLRHAPAAILAIGGGGTAKPSALAAKVARSPGDWHALFNGLPLAISRALRPERQNHSIRFGAHADAAGRLSAAGPRIGKILAHVQPPLAMPAAHVYRLAAFAGRATTISRPSHQCTAAGIIEINRQIFMPVIGLSIETLVFHSSFFKLWPVDFLIRTTSIAKLFSRSIDMTDTTLALCVAVTRSRLSAESTIVTQERLDNGVRI